MDPLTEVLRGLRLENSFYAYSELRAPWGILFTVENGACFHVVISGTCWLRMNTERVLLRAGDMVMFPHGVNHQIADTLEGSATPINELPSDRVGQYASILRFGGQGEAALLACAGMRFTGPIAHPLLKALPRLLLLRHEELSMQYSWLEGILTMLNAEITVARSGSAALMTRLMDVFLLQTIRLWMEREKDGQLGWISALNDPDIGRAIALIHHRPEHPWTVASLAAAVNLSRSVFAERFSTLVGLTPIQYTIEWRMNLASNWISEERMSLSEIANHLGYSSEAAFSRAFKHHFHVSPGTFRRNAESLGINVNARANINERK